MILVIMNRTSLNNTNHTFERRVPGPCLRSAAMRAAMPGMPGMPGPPTPAGKELLSLLLLLFLSLLIVYVLQSHFQGVRFPEMHATPQEPGTFTQKDLRTRDASLVQAMALLSARLVLSRLISPRLVPSRLVSSLIVSYLIVSQSTDAILLVLVQHANCLLIPAFPTT